MEHYRKFIDLVGIFSDWTWEVDADFHFRYSSSSSKKIIQLPADILQNKTLFDVIHDDPVTHNLTRVKELMEEQRIINNLEVWFISNNNEKFLMGLYAVPILDDDKNFIGYLGLCKSVPDFVISEQYWKRRVDELEQFKFALDLTNEVTLTDTQGNLEYVNKKFQDISKFSSDEVLGKNPRIVNSGSHSRQFFRNLYDTLSKGKIWTGVIKNKNKESDYYWIDATIIPLIRNNKCYQYLSVGHDITVQMKQEEELQKINAFQDAIFNSINHFIMSFDIEGNLISYNQEAKRLFGSKIKKTLHAHNYHNLFSRDQIQSIREKISNEVEDIASDFDTFFKMAIMGQTLTFKLNALNASGGESPVLLTISPLKDPKKRLQGFVWIGYDNSVYEKLVLEKSEYLEKIKQQLHDIELKNKELNQFAYIVSHDLKAPLRGINMLASWIKDEVGEVESDTKQKFNLLFNRVNKMENFINSLLEYAMVGKLNTDKEIIDVQTLVQEIILGLDPHKKFRINIINPLPSVNSYKVLIDQVFSNILSNSIRYNDKIDGEISIQYAESEKLHSFQIWDNGPGIPNNLRNKVFDIAESIILSGKKKGSGIGLSIVKKIIDELKGEIFLEEDNNLKGLKVIFTIPK